MVTKEIAAGVVLAGPEKQRKIPSFACTMLYQ